MKVRFEGPVTVTKSDYDGENEVLITSPEQLKTLDGKTHDSELADYLFDGASNENLKELSISGGILGLTFKDNALYLYADYFLEKKPNEEQIQTLLKDLYGQLTDGAGPIFAGDCEDELGLYPITEYAEVMPILDENT